MSLYCYTKILNQGGTVLVVTKKIMASVPFPQVLFLLDVISYTIDLTSYLSLHCYGYVVW